MTEAELLERARAGDTQAFEQLVLAQQNRVYTLCLRMLGHPEDALDVAQETFLNAWRGLSTFRGGSSFSTWLYRLARNACIDFLRKRSRRQEVESPLSPDDPDAPHIHISDPESDPHRQVEREEVRQAVELGLQALPPQQREILIMREMSGLSYQEIGDILQLDLGTVKSRIARARLALRKELTQPGNFFSKDASNPSEKRSRKGG